MSFQDFGFGLLYQRANDPPLSSVNVGTRGRSPGRKRYETEYSDVSMKKQIYFPDPPGTRRRNQSSNRRRSSSTTTRQQNTMFTSSTSQDRIASPGTNMATTPTLIESQSRSSGSRNRASSLSRYHHNQSYSLSGSSPAPALTTRCPVTERLLLDDSSVSGAVTDDSVDHSSAMVESRNSQSPSFLLDDASATMDHDGGLRPYNSRSRSDNSRGRVPSIYSHLTSEIVNFQKMVSELESLLVPSSTSHEAQWRARILMRSAQDADRDICKRLYEFDSNNGGGSGSSRAQIANRKLHRDFGRAHKQYTTILEQYEQRQQVEVSFLSSASPSIGSGAAQGQNQKRLNVIEMEGEDFFDRAMRERENELKNIQESVHKVNEIYSDLAALVGDQQEKVDKVAENINYSVGATKAGAEQIYRASHGMCAPLPETLGVGEDGIGWGGFVGRNDKTNSNNPLPDNRFNTQRGATHRQGESFDWSMPFETLRDDIRSVQKDVFQFGREIVEDMSENLDNPINIISVQNLQCNAFQCPTAGTEPGSDDVIYFSHTPARNVN